MTWIAACSGQRGTYQETRGNRMRPFDETIKEMKRAGLAYDDEERQKLCEGLRVCREPIASHCEKAANEIERLAEELQYQHACDKAQQQEIERLSAELAQARRESQMTDAEYIAFRRRIADEQGTEFVAND